MSKERKTPAVLGLDMGGTHTDAVLLRGGTLLASVKVPTNHQDLLVSTREALHALFESGAAFPADVSRATFGTTLAVNAVVQNACAPVGLLIGAGPGLDPGWFGLGGHAALVPGGVDHRGTEVAPPDREAIRRVVSGWREEGLAAFACVAKFSTRNPAHEDAMAEVIREVFSDGPEPVIALGHRLSGRLNFPRRIATAYWNAAVWTLHNRFADAVEASLKDMGIDAPAYLLKADGGAIPLSVSRERPVEALLSGPAASVMGMMALNTPIITTLIGEGGSGGALALSVADRVWMLENAVYSVISPEGCASILWKDAGKADEAAQRLKLTAWDALDLGIIERVISEKELGQSGFYTRLADRIEKELQVLMHQEDLLERRYARFRALGNPSAPPQPDHIHHTAR